MTPHCTFGASTFSESGSFWRLISCNWSLSSIREPRCTDFMDVFLVLFIFSRLASELAESEPPFLYSEEMWSVQLYMQGVSVSKGSWCEFGKGDAIMVWLDFSACTVGSRLRCVLCVGPSCWGANTLPLFKVLHTWETWNVTLECFRFTWAVSFSSVLLQVSSFLFCSLWRPVREKQRLSCPAAKFLLSSTQLWLLQIAPLGRWPFSGLRRLEVFLGLSDTKLTGRHFGLLWSKILVGLVDVRGMAGYSGDGRLLDSKPEEDLLKDEVFLSLPEINKCNVCRSCSCQSLWCISNLNTTTAVQPVMEKGHGCERMPEKGKGSKQKMCATNEQWMEESKQAVKSGKAWSRLFLTLNQDRSTLWKRLRLQT